MLKLNKQNFYFLKDKTVTNYLEKYTINELHGENNENIIFKMMAETVYNYYHNDYNFTPAIYCYQGTY